MSHWRSIQASIKDWYTLKWCTLALYLPVKVPLREKRPNTEFFLVRIFPHSEHGDLRSKSPYSVQMRGNTDKKNLRIWTLFTQCSVIGPVCANQKWYTKLKNVFCNDWAILICKTSQESFKLIVGTWDIKLYARIFVKNTLRKMNIFPVFYRHIFFSLLFCMNNDSKTPSVSFAVIL